MNTNVLGLISSFQRLKVLVVGEAMLDSYLTGTTGRICREAPVPVVDVTERVDAPGGAANTAANIASLGGQAAFLSVIGDDLEGNLLRQSLERMGVATEHIIVQAGRRTLAKHRVSAAGHMLVRFDQGSTEPIEGDTESALIERLADLFLCYDAVIVSDYGYGTLTPRVIEALGRLQAETPQLVVADSKKLAQYRHIGVTAVKPNYDEATQLLGLRKLQDTEARAEQMMAQGERVLEVTGAQIAAVTLDRDGALVFEHGSPAYRTYAQPTPNSRAAGAGDTFVSALTLALAAGAQTPTAAELASSAAALVVAKDGTSTCSAAELQEHVLAGDKHLPSIERLAARAELYRQQGKRIVFTNGCFDILHRGHITYLNKAKSLGDVLIVGVNTDSGVARLKGPNRPINTLEDRVQVLNALSCVDHTVAFDEATPINLIAAVKPDIFVKGGDYTRETLPEAALVEEQGGRVQILPYMDNKSTTGIIERIREAYALPDLPAKALGEGRQQIAVPSHKEGTQAVTSRQPGRRDKK